MSDGCISYPGSPAEAAVPPSIIRSVVLAWDAGGNSIDMLDGNVRLRFTMPTPTTSAICGLKGSLAGVGVPDLVDYGFIFQKATPTGNRYAVIERGVIKFGFQARASELDETFVILRTRNTIAYRVNNVQVYTSTRKSSGPLVVSGCLFASGDSIG